MRTFAYLLPFVLVIGGGDNGGSDGGGGGRALSASTDGNGGGGVDLSTGGGGGDGGGGGACSMTPQTGDGTSCAASNCPAGQIGVNLPGGCVCYYKCDPAVQSQCSCDRRCVPLTAPDAGPVGGACLPGIGAGNLCGAGQSKPCAQGLTCAGASGSPKAYCLYECGGQADCPAQTNCVDILDANNKVIDKACFYFYGAAGKADGAMCIPSDACITGDLCNTTCQKQCDGTADTTTGAGKTCTVVNDPAKNNKVIGYTCQ